MRKILNFLLAGILCVMSFGLFACSTNDSQYVLKIGYEKSGLGSAWIESLVDKFCLKEGIDKSKVQIVGQKGFTETIESKLDSGTEIKDIFFSMELTQMKWAAQGWLEPLDDLYEMALSDGRLVKDVIKDGYQESGCLDNIYGKHYYTIPWTESAGGIYYNKTLFEDKKWEVPTTVAELKKLCSKIYKDYVSDEPNKDKRIYPFVCSADISSYWDFVAENWWVQAIGIDEFNKFCKYESPEIYNPESVIGAGKLTALNTFKEIIVDNPNWMVGDSSDYLAAQMLFAQGKIAMMPNGAWLESELGASLPEGMEIALMPTPYIENPQQKDGKNIQVNFTCSNDCIMIPKAAKNKDLAKKFLAYMCEDEAVIDFITKTGTPRPIAIDTSGIKNLTVCQQSILDIWQNSVNFSFKTSSPFAVLGLAQVWKLGLPYAKMLYPDSAGKIQQPLDILNAEYEWVSKKWSDWMSDCGVKG